MPHSHPTTVVRGLALVVVTSVVAGVLVAGLALPVIGTAGLAAKASADSLEHESAELEAPPLPQRSRILAADGSTLATVYLNENRVVVPLAKVPPIVRQAVVAIEDARFYEHNGVDLRGLIRAFITNQRAGEVRQGGSTLTQQYVKNVLLQKADTPQERAAAVEQSISRKIREARLAMAIEDRLTKDEILERYLNISYYGNGVYGIATAAQYYFGKGLDKLTAPEAALLAGLVQSPETYNPARQENIPRAQARRDTVLQRMAELGYLTPEQAAAAQATPIALRITPTPNGCEGSFAPYFCQWVLDEAQASPALGETPEQRRAELFQGGLTITTTIDRRAQQAAQAAVDGAVPRTEANPFGTAVATVQPGTGYVRAIAVNRTFGDDASQGQTKVNYATGAGGSGFQAGSTFKAFTLARALEEGIPLDTEIEAVNEYNSLILNNPPGEEGTVDTGVFRNAEVDEAGTYDLRRCTELSINTCYVPLEERVGVLDVAALVERLGVPVDSVTPEDGSFTLGTEEVTPLEMAEAYATFAARGKHCEPLGILEIVDAGGTALPVPGPRCAQALNPTVADAVAQTLTGVVESGTARNANIGRPAAGKTGTTQNFYAAWFVGFTPQLSTAVWIGDPGGADRPKRRLRSVNIGGEYFRQVYGGGLPARIWARTMAASLEQTPPTNFPPVLPSALPGQQVAVPNVVGRSVEEAARILSDAGLGYEVQGRQQTRPADERRGRREAGLVAERTVRSTSPRVGGLVTKGETVTLNAGRLPSRLFDDDGADVTALGNG